MLGRGIFQKKNREKRRVYRKRKGLPLLESNDWQQQKQEH